MKFINFVKRHCFTFVVLLILLILFIVGFIFVKKLFFSNNGNEFGNRLDGIEENKISNDDISTIKKELETIDQVISVKDNIVGRRADFVIKVNADLEKDIAKGYADKLLEYLKDESKKYYDIQVMIITDDLESDKFPIIGYKHKSSDGFSW